MDLADSPDAINVPSQIICIKPENQSNLSKSNGSRNIRVHIPEYVSYWLPSQSNFTFNIKMSGRGNPIPSRDAGLHSLFNTCRSHDGTGSHLLEEVVGYNTLVAQQFNYTRTQATDNGRAEFEGVQQNKSSDNNLYWALAGGTSWSGGTITESQIPRSVQFVAPLRTKLWDTDQYIPCAALGGVRLELQMENYLRSLEYTTGSLGVDAVNGVATYPLAVVPGNFELPVVAGEAAVPCFQYAGGGAVAGTGYTAGNIYDFTIGGVIGGYVLVKTAPAGVPSECEIFALGEAGGAAYVQIPVAGDLLTLGKQAAPDTAQVLLCLDGINFSGDGKVGNFNQDIHMPLWAENGSAALTNLVAKAVTLGGAGAVISPANTAAQFGSNSLRDPNRVLTPRCSHGNPPGSANFNPIGCFPEMVLPFSIGDKMYVSKMDGSVETTMGVLSAVDEYIPVTGVPPGATGMPRLRMRPDRLLQTGLVNAVVAPAITAGSQVWATAAYMAMTHTHNGLKVYVKASDREVPYNLAHLNPAADYDSLQSAASAVVDFEISNFQYQAKQMLVPESVLSADMAAANSEKGLQIDLETVQTSFVNVAAIQGPTSQLITIPNITRALGVLSIPLSQTEQRGLIYRSLAGVPDNMSTYQYQLGQNGLVPQRPVPVEKASLGNPLVQTQEVNEKIKACDSFGLIVSNLNQIGMNFAVGRQFSRPGMYFNLMAAGDLILNAQFDEAQSSPKLYQHFVNHLRSINVSKSGMRISN